MKLKKSLLHGIGFLCLACFASGQEEAPKGPPPEKPAPPPERPQGGPPGGEPNSRIAEFIKRADNDSDGKISKDEFGNMAKRESEDRFSKMDANSDGFVDQTEIANLAQNMRRGPEGMRRPGETGPPGSGGENGLRRPPGGDGQGQRPQGGPPGGPPGGGRPEGGMRPGGEGGRGMGMFGDPKENFKRMDADGNGTVSEDEYIKATERLREMMRSRGGPPGQPGQPGQGGGFRRPGGEGGPPGGPRGGEDGFRRPPVEGDKPKAEGDKPKDGA